MLGLGRAGGPRGPSVVLGQGNLGVRSRRGFVDSPCCLVVGGQPELGLGSWATREKG